MEHRDRDTGRGRGTGTVRRRLEKDRQSRSKIIGHRRTSIRNSWKRKNYTNKKVLMTKREEYTGTETDRNTLYRDKEI